MLQMDEYAFNVFVSATIKSKFIINPVSLIP